MTGPTSSRRAPTRTSARRSRRCTGCERATTATSSCGASGPTPSTTPAPPTPTPRWRSSARASSAGWRSRSLRWRHASDLGALRALPFHCHFIKYDPARSVGGHYDDGSWTSVSDIGKRFGGEVLTREQYEAVEAAHVDTVLAMCRESQITTLEPQPALGGKPPPSLSVPTFAATLRRTLREEDEPHLWRDPELRFYVAVGYDYHLYAGSHVECPAAVELARSRGLQPELGHPSPYVYFE